MPGGEFELARRAPGHSPCLWFKVGPWVPKSADLEVEFSHRGPPAGSGGMWQEASLAVPAEPRPAPHASPLALFARVGFARVFSEFCDSLPESHQA